MQTKDLHLPGYRVVYVEKQDQKFLDCLGLETMMDHRTLFLSQHHQQLSIEKTLFSTVSYSEEEEEGMQQILDIGNAVVPREDSSVCTPTSGEQFEYIEVRNQSI